MRPCLFDLKISLASGSFALRFFSSPSLLHSCPCPCFSVLACDLLGPPLASAVSVFLFPSFVTQSNLSILRDGVLPLGRVVSLGLFLLVRVLTAFGLVCSSYYGSGRWFPSSPFAPGSAGLLRFASLPCSSSLHLYPWGVPTFPV